MIYTFEAIYESGVLRPLTSVPFTENQRVRITIEPIVESRTVRQVNGPDPLEGLGADFGIADLAENFKSMCKINE